MKNLSAIIFGCLVLASCGKGPVNSHLSSANETLGCKIEGRTIVCPDGSELEVVNGKDGEDGQDGEDAASGVVFKVLNPCGDSATINDEILLVLDDGTVLAYFEAGNNRRLSALEPNIRYKTTDGDNCKFEFDDSGDIVYESHNYDV